MKLAQADVAFHSRGVQSKTGYKVAQTAKVMDMFSNMLYKNKIKAVIRELSTNAWDAHVMAGSTDKVPTMHLPTREDCEFRLRDFGTGLSKDELEEMYQTYGESNKNHSNEFNGCMGIGSKSPFAYANSFTTTSYFNGTKYVYVNSKDRQGMPNIQLMVEEPTNEVNGLEISFAVDRRDISDFRKEAELVLAWFPKMFRVICSNFNPKTYNYVLDKGNWKIREFDHYNSGSYVIMGNVEYPIDVDQFDYSKDDENASKTDKVNWYTHYDYDKRTNVTKNKFYTDILKSIELHFEIGEVEMDISREGLQYTKATIEKIKDRLNVIVDSVAEEFQKEIANSPSQWDASIKLHTVLKDQFRSLGRLVDLGNVTWNGKKVPSRFDIKSLKGVNVVKFNKDSYRKNPSRTEHVDFVQSSSRVEFFLADKKVGNYIAVERAMLADDSDCKTAYLIKPLEGEKEISVEGLMEFCDAIGYSGTFNKCSDVPVPPASKRNKVENVFKLNRSPSGYGNYARKYWDAESLDFDDGGFYVEINAWNAKIPGDDLAIHAGRISKVIGALSDLGITAPTVYGIKTVSIKKYNKSEDWENFFTWAIEQVKNYVNTSGIKDGIALLHDFEKWSGKSFYEEFCKKIVPSMKKDGTILHKMLDKIRNAAILKKRSGEKANAISLIASELNLTDLDLHSNTKSTHCWEDLEKEAEKDYPVIHLVDRYDLGYKDNSGYVIQVINLIDSCKGEVENE